MHRLPHIRIDLKSILSLYVHPTTQLSMKTFAIKSFAVLMLAAALLTSCEKNSGTSSSIPKWEFDLTLDGTKSHFKYNKNASLNTGAAASFSPGLKTVLLRGNSTTDPEWVSGEAAFINFMFYEEKLGQQTAIFEWTSNSQIVSGEITIDIKDLGTPPTYNTSGEREWGKMLVVNIPSQTFSNWSESHTISGTFRAARTE